MAGNFPAHCLASVPVPVVLGRARTGLSAVLLASVHLASAEHLLGVRLLQVPEVLWLELQSPSLQALPLFFVRASAFLSFRAVVALLLLCSRAPWPFPIVLSQPQMLKFHRSRSSGPLSLLFLLLAYYQPVAVALHCQ
jgi:hypothetical protein